MKITQVIFCKSTIFVSNSYDYTVFLCALMKATKHKSEDFTGHSYLP